MKSPPCAFTPAGAVLPIALSIGVDPVHYAAIMGVNLGMGLW